MAGPAPRWALRGVTRRAVAVVALLAPANAIILTLTQEVIPGWPPTQFSPYFHVLFFVGIVTLLNSLLRAVRPSWALCHAELLVVYVLLSILSSVGGFDTLHCVLPNMAGIGYRASPENRWGELFGNLLPRDMVLLDATSLKHLYEGGSWFYGTPEAWRPWVTPLAWWISGQALLWVGQLALATLFRRRWTDVEKLTFPIARIPFELTRGRPVWLRSGAFWGAFALAFSVRMLNQLHEVRPAIPAIPVDGSGPLDIGAMIVDRPWSAGVRPENGSILLALAPLFIGFGLLVPTELLISCVVFFFFFKAQYVLFDWLGIPASGTGFPYLRDQSLGGYLGIVLFSLWVGRGYYAGVLRRILGRSGPDDSDEPVSHRAAALLFLACFLGLMWLALKQGMGWWQAMYFWGLYYMLALVIGRIRAEMGLPTHEVEHNNATEQMGNSLGVRALGARSVTTISVFLGFTRGFRSIALPHELEGFKLMRDSGGDWRRLFRAMLLATVGGLVLAWAVHLMTAYHYGLGTAKMQQYWDWHTEEVWGRAAGWISNPQGPQVSRIGIVIGGIAFYSVLMTLKLRLAWWPLHPLGFALGTAWQTHGTWHPFLIAWVVKSVATRYGGHFGAQRLLPIALGLIFGDMLVCAAWSILGPDGVLKHAPDLLRPLLG